MVRLVFRHFAADERFARSYRNEPSPGILLTLPFQAFSRVFSARYSYSNHTQDHGQWQVCMCVCVVCGCVLCMLCAVLCYICSKNMRKSINMENKTGSNHGHNVCEQIHKKHKKHWENYQNMVSFLARYGHPRTQKKSKIGHFPRRIVFTFPLEFADVFGRRSYPKRPKTPFLTRGPNPKVLIMR